MAKGNRPKWVSKAATMRALSVSRGTLEKLIALGHLTARHTHTRHYTDERPRLTTRGKVRIELRSIERYLTTLLTTRKH